tara:strand:+ start:12166 stop:13425 length:1260 start_codon:yes stop_codon:yes gene_type:complete
MSRGASLSSTYELITIIKDGKQAPLEGKTINFNYYESLYSPVVTANLTYVDAGGSTPDKKDKLTSIKDGLPITGLEDVKVKIAHPSGTLDFTRVPFKVNNAPVLSRESNRQAVMLNLVSPLEIKNSEIPLFDKFSGKISDTVTKILLEKLGLSQDKIDVESTKNDYAFVGKGKGALTLVLDLMRRSVKTKGDAGYFFFQTQEKFNFKSIDTLLEQEPKQTYTYSGALRANPENADNDFKILMEPTVIKDQDITKALKNGTYVNRNIFFDPRTFEYTEFTFSIDKDGVKKTLGGEPPLKGKLKGFTKTNHHILDIGSFDVQRITPNNDPREWQATSTMRYNLLHSQVMNIMVPCNLKLNAGDVIKLSIETISEEKEQGIEDELQSGNYLILHLCHHFDSKRSFTSMTLARDTYGKRRKNQ